MKRTVEHAVRFCCCLSFHDDHASRGGVRRRRSSSSGYRTKPVDSNQGLWGNVFTVYVIVSAEGNRYTGHTSDIVRRLREHNGGDCKSTKAGTAWRLVYAERFETRGAALKRERWLKSGVGRAYLDRQFDLW